MKKSRLKSGNREVVVSEVERTEIAHLNRQIPPIAHTSMYLWHKYWSRKTWNVVSEFIKTYCPESGIVFDPFAGSGITAMEALKNGRRVIVCDLNPIATEIVRLTIKPVDQVELHEAFERIEKKVKNKILNLYLTQCRRCGGEVAFDCAIWKEGKCIEIRYQSCPHCGDKQEKQCELTQKDGDLLRAIEAKKIKEWYPTNKFYYPDGRPFKEKQQYESVDELFTKRNLQALAWLMAAIEEESNENLKDFLKIGFSSMSHLCSRMIAISNPSETSHHTAFSSTGWTQHSYWYAKNFMEQNVWNKFDGAINGHQGIMKAKAESNKYFKDVKFASSIEKFISGKGDVYIFSGSCLELMKKMPENFVDYIFTDPPYDASIQYGELSYMWVSWLKMNGDYLKHLLSDEVIRNERGQQKNFDVYHALLRLSFQNMFKVLKSDHYLTLTFHNPTFKVRNATIHAGVFTGVV